MNAIRHLETAKYAKTWALDAYHENSPGASLVPFFERIVRPHSGAWILDIGAGDGAGARALKDRGYKVEAFDLANFGWPHRDIPLWTGSVWDEYALIQGRIFDVGYCCDMMEHIPTQFVALALRNILQACHAAFFSISFKQDAFGECIGQPLHLTVQPFTWWRDTFAEIGTILDARDLMGDGVFYVGR